MATTTTTTTTTTKELTAENAVQQQQHVIMQVFKGGTERQVASRFFIFLYIVGYSKKLDPKNSNQIPHFMEHLSLSIYIHLKIWKCENQFFYICSVLTFSDLYNIKFWLTKVFHKNAFISNFLPCIFLWHCVPGVYKMSHPGTRVTHPQPDHVEH